MTLTEGNGTEEGSKNTERMGAAMFCYSAIFSSLSKTQLCIQKV
jgi:hypothetical protein